MLESRRNLIKSLLLIIGVILFGTLGFWTIEDWTLFDSLYMTVITITTIGFKEVHEMGDGGRAFTVLLVFFSVGAVFYSLNNAARILIEGELKDIFGRRKLQKAISKLNGHYIVCGHGRMGRIICKELASRGKKYVVIERHGEHSMAPEEGTLMIHGDATKDETLQEAGIDRAGGLITVLPTDAENLYVVLSSRGMNPSLKIVARAVEEGAERKLLRAGADRVVSPYHIGGLRIAHTVLKPAVVDFIEFTTQSGNIGLQLEELIVKDCSPLGDKTLAETGIGRELGIIIVAIKEPSGKLRVNPTHDTIINVGDVLIAIGEEQQLKVLENLCHKDEPDA